MRIQSPIGRQERGVAMLMELVLVALVLTLVGLALYESNYQAPQRVEVSSQPAVATVTNEAAVAASAALAAASADATMSDATASVADQFAGSDSDTTNLENSFDANNF